MSRVTKKRNDREIKNTEKINIGRRMIIMR